MPKAEGLTLPFESEDKVRVDLLEVFEYEGNRQNIKYETKEFSAVCPFSGLPDFAQVIIEYIPNTLIVELKSLKYYLTSYRQVGIYQEHLTNRLANDLYTLLSPESLKITTIYNTRGGIDTTCVIEK
ncbi:NADPH-dependent 7-cyano-7-deazaguanine reductase QueF [Candidatus Marinamargulisbacteria bacterium SCGC AG-439-L15]|nr:NADPH-dependent 7-cyano-7-deazaguanine reductase QueF [Candidatus Marinamargulisbacteria bacterium SCGC AG-439-L15]